MLRCPDCGEENPERFRLCGYCGAQLSRPVAAEGVRKTVTVVFCDLKGSTSLGEKLDSESLREVLSVYFAAMRRVLERHGGTVEKYIGDAIMAVFGLPRLHEDDALRAVRAAFEMGTALQDLNLRLQATWGVSLENRTGVSTGANHPQPMGSPEARKVTTTSPAMSLWRACTHGAPWVFEQSSSRPVL